MLSSWETINIFLNGPLSVKTEEIEEMCGSYSDLHSCRYTGAIQLDHLAPQIVKNTEGMNI